MARILIVDDDESMCSVLSRMVTKMGHDASLAFTLEDGLREISAGEYDIVFLDVRLPDGNGLEALTLFTATVPSPEVIIITGSGDPEGAELAIRSGAWDYVEKPSSLQEMALPFMRALQYREEKHARKHVQSLAALKLEGVVGCSPRMSECYDLLARVACTDASVLITGETGTGKELFGTAVHRNSHRADRPFVVVDCSSLPETLVEGILFGHDRGAFTGADRAKHGLIKQADGGTLFLDEVGEMPLNVQKAFLRVLQERRFRPLGGKTEMESDFRLVAATNRDLEQMAEAGQFRKDLLFRIKSFMIRLPALRERQGDIKELTLHHVARLCERYGTGLKGYSPEFLEALTLYPWPGNVRELFHALERAMAAARFEATLFPKHLPEEVRVCYTKAALKKPAPAHAATGAHAPYPAGFPTLKDLKTATEKQYLRDLLSTTGGDIKQACLLSGVARSYLYVLLKQHDITPMRRQSSRQ